MNKQVATTIFVGIFMSMAGVLIGQATDSDVKNEIALIRQEIAIYHGDVIDTRVLVAAGEERINSAIARQDKKITRIEKYACREEDVHGQ